MRKSKMIIMKWLPFIWKKSFWIIPQHYIIPAQRLVTEAAIKFADFILNEWINTRTKLLDINRWYLTITLWSFTNWIMSSPPTYVLIVQIKSLQFYVLLYVQYCGPLYLKDNEKSWFFTYECEFIYVLFMNIIIYLEKNFFQLFIEREHF